VSWLIDTNVAIHFRDGDPETLERFAALDRPVVLSIVSRVELEGGVYQSSADSDLRRQRLDRMLATLLVLDFDDGAANAYRRIIEAVGFSRRKLLDRMIAAQALAKDIPLITCNGDDFRDIPRLTLIEW